MPSEHDGLRQQCGTEGDPSALFDLADRLEGAGDLHLAAIAYDRAFGLDEDHADLRDARKRLLNQLAVTERGIRFVYIPGGSFLMGSAKGELDERPVHPVELGHYWLSETPISWTTYCELAGWDAPPVGLPKNFDWKTLKKDDPVLYVPGMNKVRLQYCENETVRAQDWHAHSPPSEVRKGDGRIVSSREIFGEPAREHPVSPWGYDQKPMIAPSWDGIVSLCQKISTPGISYRLPTEAEWEKGARGGLIDKPFPWGDDPLDDRHCDYDRFDRFAIQPIRRFPANGYGLFAVSGCVWEVVSDWYDSEYYATSPRLNPAGPNEGTERVLRGGSWSDCADVQTVSYRLSRAPDRLGTPNVGFRLCRTESEPGSTPPVPEKASWWAKFGERLSRR